MKAAIETAVFLFAVTLALLIQDVHPVAAMACAAVAAAIALRNALEVPQ